MITVLASYVQKVVIQECFVLLSVLEARQRRRDPCSVQLTFLTAAKLVKTPEEVGVDELNWGC